MGVFDKLFGGGKKVSKETAETRGEHLPDLKIPIDEKFTIYFKKNGGKFIYCEDFTEVLNALQNIISENNWQSKLFYTLDKRVNERFSTEKLAFTSNSNESDIFFTTCEHLVAHNGSILVCSNQIKERKLNELPANLIVFATTSQLVDSISEALKIIKKKYPHQIPDNITTLKHFELTQENKNDFLSYGSASKNVYLLLLEDY
ncbi:MULTISPECIES: LUD domain-containing protein [Croceitalea]|uniref:LUD domain-containing protein n=1 Tax=Croceitalea vernalis TaxID=3075599 RepID=A0ABU3BL39_9FLAO|nr:MULTISPECIES: LUD domain-containing protein [unclassified Croceitalea]MDT0541013.1 LUD domain-containing protein [Croceitalea sp. P059]MDT0622862.1 LUD domain-containing protein [Croceitalea sp. P007]